MLGHRFTKEDIQSMDFGAYLASSSSDDSDNEEVELGGRGHVAAANGQERIQKYKVKNFPVQIPVYEFVSSFP